MEKNINFIVEENENNLRVDVLINKREELISRTRVKNLILKEKLKLNDQIIKSPSKKVLIKTNSKKRLHLDNFLCITLLALH